MIAVSKVLKVLALVTGIGILFSQNAENLGLLGVLVLDDGVMIGAPKFPRFQVMATISVVAVGEGSLGFKSE